jgi:hypothetical protein
MPAVQISWRQALAFRARRHHLAPDARADSATAVVERLGAVPTGSDVGLAMGLRLTTPRPDAVGAALDAGSLVPVYAFRGATHLVTPAGAARFGALRASTRMWERTSWVDHYRLTAADWPDFRATVRDVLDAGPLTRRELADALAGVPRFAHLAPHVVEGSDTLLKPLGWQGDLCFGRSRGQQPTFRRLDTVPGWPGLPDVDDAGRSAVVEYVRAYGPTTEPHLRYWLGEGLGVRRAWIGRWVRELGGRLAAVDVDGVAALVLAEDADALAATAPAPRDPWWALLPGHDQWVMGPGTADAHVVLPGVRPEVSRGAHLVLRDGVVGGTWALRDGRPVVAWHGPGAPTADELEVEVARVHQAAVG